MTCRWVKSLEMTSQGSERVTGSFARRSKCLQDGAGAPCENSDREGGNHESNDLVHRIVGKNRELFGDGEELVNEER